MRIIVNRIRQQTQPRTAKKHKEREESNRGGREERERENERGW